MEQEVYAHFIGEDRFPDLAAEEAVARLSEAVRCRTVSLPPAPEPAQESCPIRDEAVRGPGGVDPVARRGAPC